MEPESTSFWADIKKHEDTLAKDPQAYCFAPLAELYRKLGLLDDAVNVAKRGCEIHPLYVGGYMALARAYYDKGMRSDAKAAFERVVKTTPDNLLAQKLLSQIYIEEGDTSAAISALRVMLSQNPGDLKTQVMIESLSRAEQVAEQANEPAVALMPERRGEEAASVMAEPLLDEASLEEAEIIEELTEEDLEEEKPLFTEVTTVSPSSEPGHKEDHGGEAKNPLSTETLAELYISQGFPKRAIAIYRELLGADHDNLGLKQRMLDLKLAIDRDEANARNQMMSSVSEGIAEAPSVADISTVTAEQTVETDPRQQTIDTLNAWLANIRRMR